MGLLRFVFRNWPLKLAAVLLATLLYAGLIVSASASTYDGSIPITVIARPEGSYLLTDPALPDITNVRYLVIGTNHQPITNKSFSATIDLTGIKVMPGAAPVSVPVTMRATDPGTVQILEFSPARVQVRLDPVTSKVVPITVDRGVIPSGLDPRPSVLSQDSVTVSGPDSSIAQVTAAEARVRIQSADFNQDVDLIAIDARGEEVQGVRLSPRSVRVTILLNPTMATKTLPVNPAVEGSPAAHFSVTGVAVAPVLVTVEGSPDVLAALNSVATEPISVEGLDASVTKSLGLSLPAGVAALGVTSVKVSVTLTEDTGSRSYEIGLTLRNADPTTTYDIAVDRVIVTIGGPISALDRLDVAGLSATLNVVGLDPGSHRIRVVLTLPSNLDLVSISPQEVSVTVTPRPTPTPAPTATPTPSSPEPSPAATPGPSPSVVP